MAAPNPMGITECKSTVREVLRDLRRGKSLPTCKLSGGIDSKTTGNFVTYRRAPLLAQCPAGTVDGQNQVIYHQGRRPDNPAATNLSGGVEAKFEWRQTGRRDHSEYTQVQRVCIGGNNNGSFIVQSRGYDSSGDYRPITINTTHQWYDTVNVITPDGAQFEFDVTIDGKSHARHRFSF